MKILNEDETLKLNIREKERMKMDGFVDALIE